MRCEESGGPPAGRSSAGDKALVGAAASSVTGCVRAFGGDISDASVRARFPGVSLPLLPESATWFRDRFNVSIF